MHMRRAGKEYRTEMNRTVRRTACDTIGYLSNQDADVLVGTSGHANKMYRRVLMADVGYRRRSGS